MKYSVNMAKNHGFYHYVIPRCILIKSITSYIDKYVLLLSIKFCYLPIMFSLISRVVMDNHECNLNLIIGKMTVFSFQFASFKHQLFTEGLQKSGMYYSIRYQFCECCLILLECLYFNKCFIENSESEKCKL